MSDDKLVSRSAPYVAGATPNQGDAWAAEAASTGAKGTQRILFAGLINAPDDIAAMLGLPTGTEVILRRRLLSTDGKAVELANAYYPAAVAANTPLATPAKVKGGVARWLADHGYTAHHVHEEVSARHPDLFEMAALGLRAEDPVLVLQRISNDGDMQPFEAAIMVMRADGRVLAYDLDRAA